MTTMTITEAELNQRATALAWVHLYHPQATDFDLPRCISDFENAARRENCTEQCPGLGKCAYHGFLPKPVYTKLYGRFIVVFEPCVNGAAERQQAQIVRSVESAGVPERFTDCTFENYEIIKGDNQAKMSAALSLAHRCAQNDHSFILGGPPGTGKTHLAIAATKYHLSQGHSAIFIPVISLLNDIKNGFNDGTSSNVIRSLKEAHFVVIDDVGAQKDTDWVSERLFGLIDERYSSKKPTMITTNALMIQQFADMAGARGHQIASRLQENGFAHWMTGCKDYRSRVRQRNLGI